MALAVDGTISYLATDALSSVSVALDASGAPVASRLFAPYGGERYSQGAMPGSYGFTGQHEDKTTGLDYYGARYYDPVAGQFTASDNLLPGDGYDPWGLSRYAYVKGNPIARNDPTGHCAFLCTMIVGAVVGAAISYGSQVISNVQKGQDLGHALTNVDAGEIGKAALMGAVIGATGFAAAGAVGLAGETLAMTVGSSVARVGITVGTKLAVGAAEGAASQVAYNVANGRRWSDDLGSATLFGLATAGVSAAGSSALRRYGGRFITQRVRASALSVVDDSLQDMHTIRSMRKLARSWSRAEIDDAIANGPATRTSDWRGRGAKNAVPATRFKNPSTGKSLTVNNQTGRIVQLGARNFRYDRYDFIARVRGWW